MIFHMKGKKLENLPDLLFDENEPGLPYSQNKVTTLEHYHDEHEKKGCRAYKLLGVYLDEHLSLNCHVEHIVGKLNKSIYCIRTAKNNLNYKGLRALYFALIHSHLSYCPSILGSLSNKNKAILAKVQKKAIRLITNSRYNAHTAPLFHAHRILPFAKIIKQGRLVFMHSIHFNYAPQSFEGLWQKKSERPGGHLIRNEHLFDLPAPRIEIFKRLPTYALAYEWNNSGNLMFYTNPCTFKHALKNQLFEEVAEEFYNT